MDSVAIVDPLSTHGGMHYYTHSLATALARQGLGVTVLAPHDALYEEAPYVWREAFTGVYGNATKLRRAAQLLAGYAASALWVRRNKTQTCIFHIFKADAFEVLGVLLAKKAGASIICIIHDVSRLDAPSRFSQMDRIVDLADGIIVHNGFSRDTLTAASPAAADKTSIMHHGSYVDQFATMAETEARDRLALPQKAKILLFFGNPRHEKGLHVLLDAMVPFAGHPELLLVVAGKMKPNDEARVRGFIKDHRLDANVRLDVGHVPDARVPEYFSAASLAVLPYLTVYESGVALMAMSFGRPVLASDLPVFADTLMHSGAGLMFASGNSEMLAAQIGEVLADKYELAAMGQQAMRFACKERSWAKAGEKMAQIIRQK